MVAWSKRLENARLHQRTRPGGKIRYEWTSGKGGAFHPTGEYLALDPYRRIIHVERMHLPDPPTDTHIETRFDADGEGTLMTIRMTLPDTQTRAAMLAAGVSAIHDLGRRGELPYHNHMRAAFGEKSGAPKLTLQEGGLDR